LKNGGLTLHLELSWGEWYPEADNGLSMKIATFAEQGKPPEVPALDSRSSEHPNSRFHSQRRRDPGFAFFRERDRNIPVLCECRRANLSAWSPFSRGQPTLWRLYR